jgi:DNA polymerase-3 subunit gamma/tau
MVAAMATQSLYRRYRPRRFSEVKGQDHVVRALRTAVAEGREGQAYLFSGPRGTGKTTSARILAKVLNCQNPQAGEPCCECESCLAVERGVSYDVHELDAASNNGVEAMRDLIEKTSLGTPGRHKVYILDEVHMLSKAAEAALLKTLEEPPPHVVFVLATTDPQKMSDTIRSRTQHLQFHLLPADTLADHVRWVAADAGLDLSDAAFDQVLRRGGGSARDALSALELAASTGDEGLDVVVLDEFVEAMIEREPGRAITLVGHAIASGIDTRTLTEELIAVLRDGFLALMAPELVQVPSSRVDELASQAQRLGAAGLVRGIEQLGTALAEMRHAPDPRVLLDVVAVQLTSDQASSDNTALLQRIERLERQLADGVAVAAAAPGAAASPDPAPVPPVDPTTGRKALGGRARTTPPPSSEPAAPPPPTAAASGTGAAPGIGAEPTGGAAGVAITADDWDNTIRPGLRGMARAVYAPAGFVRSTTSTLSLSVPNAVHRGKCEQQRSVVEAALQRFAGAPVVVELLDDDGGRSGASGGAGATEARPGGPDVGGPVADDAAGGATTPSSSANGPSPVARRRPEPARHPEPDYPEVAAAVFPDDDDVDLDDLIDAPPESVKSPIDRLAEAFPGSELIEDAS